MDVACTCAGQDEAKPEGTNKKNITRHAPYAWRLIGSNVDGLGELMTVYARTVSDSLALQEVISYDIPSREP